MPCDGEKWMPEDYETFPLYFDSNTPIINTLPYWLGPGDVASGLIKHA